MLHNTKIIKINIITYQDLHTLLTNRQGLPKATWLFPKMKKIKEKLPCSGLSLSLCEHINRYANTYMHVQNDKRMLTDVRRYFYSIYMLFHTTLKYAILSQSQSTRAFNSEKAEATDKIYGIPHGKKLATNPLQRRKTLMFMNPHFRYALLIVSISRKVTFLLDVRAPDPDIFLACPRFRLSYLRKDLCHKRASPIGLGKDSQCIIPRGYFTVD